MRSVRCAVLAVAAAVWLMGAPPAKAGGMPGPNNPQDICDTEEGIFWGNWLSSQGDWQKAAFGTRNQIVLKARALNPNCNGHITTFSTAHQMLGGVYGNWVEAGWLRYKDSQGFVQLLYFTEGGLAFDTLWGPYVNAWPCTPVYDTYDIWQVANVAGTTNWEFKLNCNDGSGYHTLQSTIANTGYNKGTPAGETGRRGGTQTGMSDHHNFLKYMKIDGTWADWSQPKCRVDYASNWDGEYISSVEYETDFGQVNC